MAGDCEAKGSEWRHESHGEKAVLQRSAKKQWNCSTVNEEIQDSNSTTVLYVYGSCRKSDTNDQQNQQSIKDVERG